MRLIRQALHKEKPVLGICLGSQLLAATLGAVVRKGDKKEIGWHPIRLTKFARKDELLDSIEPCFMAFHWHGDIFELPRGAILLASSELTEFQAFRYGHNAYGFLFHAEVTEEIIDCMVKTFMHELQESGINPFDVLTKTKGYLPHLRRIGRLIFQKWVGLIKITA
ncbi:MAG: type 1 glutamine amidotransferase [Candidatus Bathyarchaeia archaeon]